MKDWKDISTAPKTGDPIYLKSETYEPPYTFFYNKKMDRWDTVILGVVGKVKAWWAEEFEQPTHWRAA